MYTKKTDFSKKVDTPSLIMKQIVIFASGEGTNAQRLIDYFDREDAKVALVVCNNPNAQVLKRADRSGIPYILVTRDTFYRTEILLDRLHQDKIDLIVCAGFLWKVPLYILQAFPNRVINIHPALLPMFGGKGMYGMNVHRVVIESGEKESGITIHYLNENYDEGKIIFQAKCEVLKNETPEQLAQKIHQLEYQYFPIIVKQVVDQLT